MVLTQKRLLINLPSSWKTCSHVENWKMSANFLNLFIFFIRNNMRTINFTYVQLFYLRRLTDFYVAEIPLNNHLSVYMNIKLSTLLCFMFTILQFCSSISKLTSNSIFWKYIRCVLTRDNIVILLWFWMWFCSTVSNLCCDFK